MSYLFSCEEPWLISENKITYKGEIIAEIHGDDEDELEANVRLIRAAPELYKRLLGLCFVIRGMYNLNKRAKLSSSKNELLDELSKEADEASDFLRSISATLVDNHYNECFGGNS